jgi:hypothetical protein
MERLAFATVNIGKRAEFIRNQFHDRAFLFAHQLQDFADSEVSFGYCWQVATFGALLLLL